MNRRDFVAVSLAAGTAWAAAEKPVGVAFLGASHSHAKDKLKVVQGLGLYRLIGVWDEDDAVRQALIKQGLKVTAPDELLRNPEVEAVIVESDVPDHQRHARMALSARKHVHVEKPPATDVAGFRELLDLAARHKLVFQQGYMWRHHPGFHALTDVVKSGAIGDVYLVTAVMHKTLEAERRPEWARFRGGQMFEQCSHLVDQMVRLMGRPDRITPFLKKSGKFDDNLADNTVAVLEFPAALGIVIGSALNPDGNRYRSFTVSGTKGTAILDPVEPGDFYVDLKVAAGPFSKGRQKIKTAPYVRFEDDFKEMAAAIRQGKPLSVTPMQDLIVQEAIVETSGM